MKSRTKDTELIESDELLESNKQAISGSVLSSSFIRAFFQYVRLAELHDPTNAIFDQALVEILRLARQMMETAGGSGLHLAFRGEIIFLNGKSIRPKARQFHIYKYLVRFFRTRQLGGFRLLVLPEGAHFKEV